MEMNPRLLAAVTLLATFSALEANAQTANLNVSAQVPEVCSFDAASFDLSFGALPVAAGSPASTSVSTNIEFRCSLGTTVDIALDLGQGPAPSLAARQMRGTNDINNLLPYLLETPTNTQWGSTVGTDTVNITSLDITQLNVVPVTGTITLADTQAANADTYNDTVVITLNL